MPSVARWRRILGQRASWAFRYKPGDSLAALGMTATRASSALYRDATGIWQTANANVLRDAHWQYDTLLGRSVRTLLREGAGTNSALGSCSFSDATYWGSVAAYTIAAATSCIAGQTAYKHTSGGTGPSRSRAVGVFVDGQTDCLSFLLENDVANPATTTTLGIYDNGAPQAWVHEITLTWATKAAATIAGSGTSGVIDLGTGPNGGALVRVYLTGTGTAAGTGAAGNSRYPIIYTSGTANNTKAIIIHHAQFEAATSYPSSPIVTVAAAVTRAADVISVSWTRNPEAGTFYIDAYNLNAVSAASKYVWNIGTGTTNRLAIYLPAANAFEWFNYDAAGNTNIQNTGPAVATYGIRAECRVAMNATWQGTAGIAYSGGAETLMTGGTNTARTLPPAYSVTALNIGSTSAGGAGANLAIRSIAIVLGNEQSMATCRQIAGT